MTIEFDYEKFDYEKFALDMVEQSKPLIPNDLTVIQKTYVSNIILSHTRLVGETLSKEHVLELNDRQKMFIVQAIAEWLFHKSIDSLRAGVPSKYIDYSMEVLSLIIFEVTKQGFLEKTPENKLLRILEQSIKEVYKEIILALKAARYINEKTAKDALQQSNIDRMFGKVTNKTLRGLISYPR